MKAIFNNTLLLISVFLGSMHFSFAASVDTVSIYSAAMKKNIKCVVILPESYSKVDLQKFPVVYLLHGYSGNYANWVKNVSSIKDYADDYHLIIVCPDGAYSSWYFDSPIDHSSLYKTYIGEELPAYIDSAYRTVAEKKGRAISGLSMGGHGAIYLAWNYPNTYSAAGSMSGAVNLVPWKSKFGLPEVLGDSLNNPLFERNSVLNKIKNPLSAYPKLIIDCGIDDFFIGDNRLFHQELINMNIPHDYIERPGKHNWEYWKNSVIYQLMFFHRFFSENS